MKAKSSRTSYQQFIQQFKQPSEIIKQNHLNVSQRINTSINQSQFSQSSSQKNTNPIQKIAKVTQKEKTSLFPQQSIKNHTVSYNYNKFIEQITEILIQIIPGDPSQLLSHKISYIQYLEAFKALKMIHHSYQPYPNDLVAQLWHQFLTQNHVANFIFIVGSILQCSSTCDKRSNSVDNYLSQKYQSLRITRLELIGQFRYQNNQKDHVSKLELERIKHSKSKQNLTKYPSKLNTYFYNKTKTSSSFQKKQRTSERSQYTDRSVPINSKGRNGIIKTDRSLQNKSKIKSEQINKLQSKSSKKIKCIEEHSISSNQMRHILRQKSVQKGMKNFKRVKGQQNKIHRMIKGRIERQLKEIIADKGSTYNEKMAQKIRKQRYKDIFVKVKQNTNNANKKIENKEDKEIEKEKEFKKEIKKQLKKQIPKDHFEQKNKFNQQQKTKDMIVVNIFIQEDRCQKLIYHKGQESINDAAQRFVNQYKLGSRQKDKLINELENVIKFSLTSIKEEEEESIDQQSKESRVG